MKWSLKFYPYRTISHLAFTLVLHNFLNALVTYPLSLQIFSTSLSVWGHTLLNWKCPKLYPSTKLMIKKMPAIIDRFHYCQTSTGFLRKLCTTEWKFSYKNTNYYLHPNTVFAHSTEHAILDMVESIRTNMDKRLFSCGVFIDLKKAFDTVDHKILLAKLNYYGFRGIDNQWLSSYLTNSTQTTEINS